MKKVMVVGGATQDIFIYYETGGSSSEVKKNEKTFIMLEEGSKIEVQKLHYATGGGATNSGVSFSRLGFEVSCFFKLGKDTTAQFIYDHLNKENISQQHVVYSETTPSGTSFIIPSASGNRTILAFRGSNAEIVESEIPFYEINNNNQCIYITSLSGKSSQILLPFTKYAKEHGLMVANNPGSSQLKLGAEIIKQSLAYIDIFILNCCEAQILMQTLLEDPECYQRFCNLKKIAKTQQPQLLQTFLETERTCLSIRHYFSEVLSRGPRIVIVTNGKEGVYAATRENIYFHPSKKTKIINSVGAGDAFGSCFVASLLHDKGIEQAIVNGIINSASVLQGVDAKSGLLTWKKLQHETQEFGTSQLQKFTW